MIRFYVVLALTCLLAPSTEAQSWSWAFATANLENGRGAGADVATDAGGNAYVIGTFQESMTVGGTTLTAQGEDAFVLKLTSSGDPVWAFQIGGADRDVGSSIAVGPDGAIYVVGQFSGTATVGATSITSAGSADVFVAKLTDDGAVTWARALGGPDFENGVAIATDAGGDVYVTGGFVNTTDIGGTSLTSVGSGDLFLARLTGEGAVTWAVRAGGTGSDLALGLAAAPDGSTALAGRFEETATFDTASVTSTGASDAFVARYNADGTVAWVASGGNPVNNDYAYGVAFTSNGDIVAAGDFSNTATFGSTERTSNGDADGFVARYGTEGALVWIRQIGGDEYDTAGKLAVGDGDVITVIGSFNGSITLDTTTLTSAGRADVFFVRYDGDGTEGWAARGGGPGTAGFSERAGGIAAVGSGVVATGAFYEDAEFGPFVLSAAPQNHSGVFVVGLDLNPVAAEANPAAQSLRLSPPHPNPASTSVAFALDIVEPHSVRVEAFDVLGRRVAILHDGPMATSASLQLDTSTLRPGIYVLRVTAGTMRATRRFTVVR